MEVNLYTFTRSANQKNTHAVKTRVWFGLHNKQFPTPVKECFVGGFTLSLLLMFYFKLLVPMCCVGVV